MTKRNCAKVGTVLVTAGLCASAAVWYYVKEPVPIPLTKAQVTSMPSPPSRFVHEFGVVSAGAHLEHEFVITNDGPVPWTPLEVRAGCSCVGAVASRETVRPGDQFAIRLKYRAPQKEGFDKQRAVVAVKELGNSPIVFEIRASVVHDLSVSPKNLTVPLARGKTAKRVIEVLNNSDRDWEGVSVLADVPWLKTGVHVDEAMTTNPDFPKCRQRWSVPVTFYSAGMRSGESNGNLIIKAQTTNDIPATKIGVTVKVAPEVEVIPDQVFLGDIAPNENREFSLFLRFSLDNCPKTPSILKVSHDFGEAVSYDLVAPNDAPVWTIRFRVDGNKLVAHGRYVRGIIRINFGQDSDVTIEVPLFVKVRS
jgi:hypothetical protein